MWRLALATLSLIGACVRSQSVHCGEYVCPEGTACAAYKDRPLCVMPEQTQVCDGAPDGAECLAGFRGTCYGDVCFPVGCGNGAVDDPLYGTGEQCDDENLLGHDGCSSTCQTEAPQWEVVSDQQLELICKHAVASDMSRGTSVMFGGKSYGAVLTWELCDETWRLRRPPVSPPTRMGHALVEDGRRKRTVLFGGRSDGIVRGDTWEWLGSTWLRSQPKSQPPARAEHAMAYDSLRGVTVMFGGRVASGAVMDDLWEWDGTDWTERAEPELRPSARADHLMAYDPARAVIVLVGADTWEYDGATFRNVTPSGPVPPSPVGAAMAYDAIERRIVLHGGSIPSTSTWSWDGVQWTERTTAPGPDRPLHGALSTDPVTGRALWSGGSTGADTCQDLDVRSGARSFRKDATSWTEIVHRRYLPPARQDFAVVLDVHRHRAVMFGGRLSQGVDGETWELGPGGWDQRTGMGMQPSPRQGHGMAYDTARRETILFGGADEPITWTWNGDQWTARATPVRPPVCEGASMTFDLDRKVAVLFGGEDCNQLGLLFGETWEWNGTSWTRLQLQGPGPEARRDSALAYDPIRKQTILFGGQAMNGSARFADTWAWDGTRWTRLDPTSIPDARSAHGLAWDPARQRLVLVGGTPAAEVWEWDGVDWSPMSGAPITTSDVAVPGLDGAGILVFETAVFGFVSVRKLHWSAATSYEACQAGDHDGDGLVGCADPDCWATCQPACPPGASCDPAQPKCGDQLCSSIENQRSCPQDCGPAPVLCGDFICSDGEQCPGDCDW